MIGRDSIEVAAFQRSPERSAVRSLTQWGSANIFRRLKIWQIIFLFREEEVLRACLRPDWLAAPPRLNNLVQRRRAAHMHNIDRRPCQLRQRNCPLGCLALQQRRARMRVMRSEEHTS